jgi:hypothetical protein
LYCHFSVVVQAHNFIIAREYAFVFPFVQSGSEDKLLREARIFRVLHFDLEDGCRGELIFAVMCNYGGELDSKMLRY